MRLSMTVEQAVHFSNIPMTSESADELLRICREVDRSDNPHAYAYVSVDLYEQLGPKKEVRVRVSKMGV